MKNFFNLLAFTVLVSLNANAAGADPKIRYSTGVEGVAAPVSVYSISDLQKIMETISQDNQITESEINIERSADLQEVRYEITQGNQIIEADLSNSYQPLDFKKINSVKNQMKVNLPLKVKQ